jgi:sugar lactone lactonase YvrE
MDGLSGTDECPMGAYHHIYTPAECSYAANWYGYADRVEVNVDSVECEGCEEEPEYDPCRPTGCYVKNDMMIRPGGRGVFFNGPRDMSPEELKAFFAEQDANCEIEDKFKPMCGQCPGDTPAPTPQPTPDCEEIPGNDPAAERGAHDVIVNFNTAPGLEHSDGHIYAHYAGGVALDGCDRLHWGEMWMNCNEDGDTAVYRFPVDKMTSMPVSMQWKEQLFPQELFGWGKAVYQFDMTKPRYIALRPGGWIYSCDIQRVIKFRPGELNAVIVAGGQGEEDEERQIGQCEAIGFDAEDRFYVSDSWNNRLNRYTEGGSGTADATLVAGPGEKQSNGRVAVKGVWIQPRGNAILSDGSVLLVDRAASRVIRWNPDASVSRNAYSPGTGYGYVGGEVVAGGKGHNCGAHQLRFPHGLAAYEHDGVTTMYIMDTGCSRVQEWNIGDTTGEMIAGTGTKGDWNYATMNYEVADDQIQHGEIVVFHRGWLYITDAMKDRIVRWGTGFR